MEGWGKIGVQSASVLYPNSCYNELCYIEVQVYFYAQYIGNFYILLANDIISFEQTELRFDIVSGGNKMAS